MKWNHRILQADDGSGEGDPFYKVVETYYNDDGSIAGYTDVCVGAEDPFRLLSLLNRMITDIQRQPNVIYPDDAVGFKNINEHTPF